MAPWYELGEAVAVTVLCLLLLLSLWLVLDRRGRAAAALRQASKCSGATNILWGLVGLSALFIAAEEVLDRGSEELLPGLDILARHAAQLLGGSPMIYAAAWRLSDLTGIGLVTTVASVALCLFVLRHGREAVLVLIGSLSAWVLSGVLKLAFRVPRPHSSTLGFPSGHVLVAVVGCGLVAWALGRFAGCRTRRILYGAAGATALLSGAARVILDAHWVSDVIGGLAAGTVWLNLVILIALRFSPEEHQPLSQESFVGMRVIE